MGCLVELLLPTLSFAKPILLSLFLKTPCQATNELHLPKVGGQFSVFLLDVSTAFGDRSASPSLGFQENLIPWLLFLGLLC